MSKGWKQSWVGKGGIALVVLGVLGALGTIAVRLLTWEQAEARGRDTEHEPHETRSRASSPPSSTQRLVVADEAQRGGTSQGFAKILKVQTTAERPDKASAPASNQRAALKDLDLPWRHPGQCVGGAGAAFEEARARYLATFVPVSVWSTTLYVHPRVWPSAVSTVRDKVERIHRSATGYVGLESLPPVIYLYPSVESLREHSCSSVSAVAYYDGAIHLAPVALGAEHELIKSLRHEYVHHVLVSNGVGGPIWFQEGAATAFARDEPAGYYELWRKNPIHLREMVTGFPKGAPLEVTTRFYAHAYVMTEFLDRLCLARLDCKPAELAHALESGAATPETLFDWATSRRGSDLFHTSRLPLWDDYVMRGNFAPATLDALLRRALPGLNSTARAPASG